MGKDIQLTASDGFKAGAYAAEAEAPRGGIVVLQEIFGVNAYIRRVVDGFATDGFNTIAPALFDRIGQDVQLAYDGEGTAEGLRLRSLASEAEALLDIEAAIAAVSESGPVFVVGYSWGGYLAWLSAARLGGIAGAVCYYGVGIGSKAGEAPGAPVLLHFGEQDHAVPMSEVAAIQAAHAAVIIELYPSGHGFDCELCAKFDAGSAAAAAVHTADFLDRVMARG